MAIAGNAGLIGRCWSGRARLWQAYWLVGVFGQLCILLLLALAGALWWRGPQDNPWFHATAAGVVAIWFVYSAVSIWRCAPNASRQVWGTLARVVLVPSLAAGYGLFTLWGAL